jgi:hypothetical protein
MVNIENSIIKLKRNKRDNYYFLRRRVDKGNGKKTLGWILKKDNTAKTLEGLDFYKLKDRLKEL